MQGALVGEMNSGTPMQREGVMSPCVEYSMALTAITAVKSTAAAIRFMAAHLTPSALRAG